ncbi:MAG: LytTR family DNA-binding domain-containing protein [Bacteroidota bacterium]
MNCIIVDDDPFSRKILKDYINKTNLLSLVTECSSAIEAVNVLREENVDLMFLDIKMPEMTGMELIKNFDNIPLTIIITSFEKYAVEAFEYNVTDYIVKPVSYARFIKAVERANQLHENQMVDVSGKDFFVKSSGMLVKINSEEILWIEALENYIVINTIKDKYTVHMTMKSLEDKLHPEEFIRVHRSFFVRKDKIESITEDVIVIGDENIPIGRTYKNELSKRIKLL